LLPRFGFEWQPAGVTAAKLRDAAKRAYDLARTSDGNSRILVSALYIPGEGIYFGTLPDRSGQAKFRDAIAGFPQLVALYANRQLVAGANPSASLWHAEDAAIYWAYFKEGAKADQLPDAGSMITTYGQYLSGDTPARRAACQAGSITPNCQQTLATMGIREA
jgi:hypothetical protein